MSAIRHGASQSRLFVLCLLAWNYKASIWVIHSNSDCSANSSGIGLGFDAPGPVGARFLPPSPITATWKTNPEPGPCKGCVTPAPVSLGCWHRAPGRTQCLSAWVRQTYKYQFALSERSAWHERHCQTWVIWGYFLFISFAFLSWIYPFKNHRKERKRC